MARLDLGSAFNLPINNEAPQIMHVDMNSCFATMEQQANPLLRGRPVAVSAYATSRGIIIAPSVEAKRFGIKLGMRNAEARAICPEIIILEPDPAKYRYAHSSFKNILLSYTPKVYPKSIDEAVIDFRNADRRNHDLFGIAKDIKRQIKQDLASGYASVSALALTGFWPR